MLRKSLEYQTRRQFIIEATRSLLAARGVESTSMEDIAAAADYTRRTLYAYFKSRDEILLAVLIEDLKLRWADQQVAIADAKTGLDKIIVWAESFYLFARENPHAMRVQYYWDFTGVDREKIGDEVFAAFETINDELADGLRAILRLGIADGSLRSDLNIDMCISQYLYSLRAVVNRALATTYSFAAFDADEYLRHYLDLFSRGIRSTKGPHR